MLRPPGPDRNEASGLGLPRAFNQHRSASQHIPRSSLSHRYPYTPHHTHTRSSPAPQARDHFSTELFVPRKQAGPEGTPPAVSENVDHFQNPFAATSSNLPTSVLQVAARDFISAFNEPRHTLQQSEPPPGHAARGASNKYEAVRFGTQYTTSPSRSSSILQNFSTPSVRSALNDHSPSRTVNDLRLSKETAPSLPTTPGSIGILGLGSPHSHISVAPALYLTPSLPEVQTSQPTSTVVVMTAISQCRVEATARASSAEATLILPRSKRRGSPRNKKGCLTCRVRRKVW